MAKKSNKRPEHLPGGYLAIPWTVFESVAFKGATASARALIMALARQWNGFNNGHLQMTQSWMKEMGYTNLQQNKNARNELIERGLIVYTRRGGLNMGADNFALTWLDISNFSGLHITFREYEKGKYLSCDLPPTPRRKQPKKIRHSLNVSAMIQSSYLVLSSDHQTHSVYESAVRGFSPITNSLNEYNVFSHYLRCLLAQIYVYNSFRINKSTTYMNRLKQNIVIQGKGLL